MHTIADRPQQNAKTGLKLKYQQKRSLLLMHAHGGR